MNNSDMCSETNPWRLTYGRLICLMIACLIGVHPVWAAHNGDDKSSIALELAITLLGDKYGVHFTYDRTLIVDVEVDYDENHRSSIDDELLMLLSETSLRFQIFEENFVILYHSEQEGTEAVEMLMSRLAGSSGDPGGEYRQSRMLDQLSSKYRVKDSQVGAIQNEMNVSGIVSDENGEPLIGVNVIVKGSDVGTATDFDGHFQLDGVDPEAVLVFSYIGYQTQEVEVEGRTSIDVTLLDDAQTLEEVIVVGYGTQKKVNVSGAVDFIDGKDIENRPVANVMQGLQGASPGLNINYAGGTPGSKPTINIRGFTSINGGEPLVVIDGVASSFDDLLRINPGDIESFSVLKDAASSAIYGARAAYGVILINTKSGSSGKPKIEYRNYMAWGRPTVLPDPVTDPYIFARVKDIASGNTPWDYINYTDEQFRWARERSENPDVEDIRLDPEDPTKWAYMGDNNWYDYFLNKSALSYNHSLSFSGGIELEDGKKIRYYLSGDLTDENGLNKLADDYYNRNGLRARLDFDALDWLELSNNVNVYQTKRSSPRTSLTDLYYLIPIDVAENPDGTWANNDAGRMAAQLVDGGGNMNTLIGFQEIFSANAYFLDRALTLTGRASFKKELWRYQNHTTKYQIGSGPDDIRTEGGTGNVWERNGQLDNTILDLFATYEKSLGDDHYMKILGEFNQEAYSYSSMESSKDGIISSSLPYMNLTSGDPRITAGYSAYATRSLFGRINYHYMDRYLLEFNGRYDGSSRFPKNNRWGFFPSVSMGYVISEEPFMKNLFDDNVPYLKLRASYGDLGNQSVGNFAYIQTLATGNSSYLIDGKQPTVITGGAPSLEVDPDNYTWERVSTINLGADAGFFNGRLQGTFDVYNRKTLGMLTAGQELPGVLGSSVPSQNIADLKTKGWEVSLSYRDQTTLAGRPLDFDMKFILSDSRSWITRFKNDQNLFSNWREGEEIGELWGLDGDGFFANEEEIEDLDQTEIIPWGALTIVPGWPKFVDHDGNGKIQIGRSADDPKDLIKIGNTSSRYRVGANLNAMWNGFDVSVFLQGVLKRDFYPQHYLYWGPYQQPYAGIYPWNLDFYRAEDDSEYLREQHSQSYIDAGLADQNLDAKFPVLQSWLADDNYGSGLAQPNNQYLLSSAYLRLKNLTVGYTLPDNLIERIGISRVRVFFTGENLYEISPIKKFMDPEAVEDGYGWAYPFQRKISMGVDINF